MKSGRSMVAMFVGGLLVLAGCNGDDNKNSSMTPPGSHETRHVHVHRSGEEHEDEHHATEAGSTTHDHSHWWCGEHGVPEHVCGLCNSRLAAQMQKAGDWCAEHDRPDSQCFECHPELEARFAAQYVAKYGHQPPARSK